MIAGAIATFAALTNVKPAGWTPTGFALNEAQKDLAQFKGANNTNIIYLVSDGVETCDSNPIDAAKKLYESDITPIINVIGFDVDGEGQNHLREIADAVNGIYQTVKDENELASEFQKVNDIAQAWEEWKEKGMQQLDFKKTNNNLKIFIYITNQNVNAGDEHRSIYLIISALEDYGYMSKESFRYLEKKNSEYHKWIRSEIDKFEEQLEKLNEASYKEAIKALEEKYKINTQD